MAVNLRDRVKEYFVIALVVLFGTSTWVAINGLWVELPLMVALGIPEGYNIASYLVIIIQVANIGPLVYTILSRFIRGNKLEVPTIYLTLLMSVISCLLLVFFWDTTTYWPAFGENRSTALLSLSFILALVNCTSSVTFIPFMVRLKSSYMTWFFVGQGFSSLAPSLVALGQGVRNQECVINQTYVDELSGDNCTTWIPQTRNSNFPPETFFWFLFASMALSLLAFLCLHQSPYGKGEYAPCRQIPAAVTPRSDNHANEASESLTEECGMKLIESPQDAERGESEETQDNGTEVTSPARDESLKNVEDGRTKNKKRSTGEYVILFIVIGVVNALKNSVLPSIQTYSCGAYGFHAYLLAATLANVANPIACFIVMFFPQKGVVPVVLNGLLGILAGGYCLATAILSPLPPLHRTEPVGTVLVVIAWIVVGGVFAHVKATVGWILRHEPDNHRLLTIYGIVTQVGSVIGAVIMFPVVNFLDVFTPYEYDVCEGYHTCEAL